MNLNYFKYYDSEGRIGFTEDMISFKDEIYNQLDRCSRKRFTSFLKFVESKKEYDDFSKVIYFMTDEKVEIICKKHGEYKISPNGYLFNHRCDMCNHNMITESEFKLKLKEKFPHLNIEDKFINLTKEITVKCLLCGEEKRIRPIKLLNSTYGCKCLGGNKKITTEEYKIEIRNNNIECLEDYINNRTPILHKCLVCNYQWKSRPNSLKTCPNCSYKRVSDNKKFSLDYINDKLKNNERNLICVEYNGIHDSCKFVCLKCNYEWKSRGGSVINGGCGCPNCHSSSNETVIKDWLTNHKIEYVQEYKFEDCKYKQKLPFDFYIPKYNILIEMQGEQHYKPVKFRKSMTNEECIENFKYRQKLDNIKKSYALENGYTFIDISYKENIIKQLEYVFSHFIIK